MTHSDELPENIAPALAEVWQRAAPAYGERAAAIQRAIRDLTSGSLSAEQRERALKDAHLLAGSLGTFGLGRGTALARELESALAADDLAPPNAERLSRLGDELEREILRRRM
jgi:HPt (histidine-containing phosphotransfer) domain-containing protein